MRLSQPLMENPTAEQMEEIDHIVRIAGRRLHVSEFKGLNDETRYAYALQETDERIERNKIWNLKEHVSLIMHHGSGNHIEFSVSSGGTGFGAEGVALMTVDAASIQLALTRIRALKFQFVTIQE